MIGTELLIQRCETPLTKHSLLNRTLGTVADIVQCDGVALDGI
jgi:hypothetical protein